jgi:ABC-type phosphate transport system substrate-binding protein
MSGFGQNLARRSRHVHEANPQMIVATATFIRHSLTHLSEEPRMARTKSLLSLGAALTAAVTVCTMGTAHADLAPSTSDVIGIGSDTVQNITNFLADGDNVGGSGYNSTGPKNRLVSFDATPDQNDRAGYLNGSTNASLKALNPTIVLRQGLQPVQRPNGSGAGINALLADGGHVLDYVRMSRLPTVAEQNTATAKAGVGALRVVKIATDDLQIAVNKTASNAPAAGLTAAQLVGIYQCTTTDWATVGGTAGTPIPIIPQTGSGTRSSFLADLQAANGGTAVTLGGCVVTTEENDPTSITGSASPVNTIAPFSAGRKALYDSGYFNNPANAFQATQVPLTSGVNLLPGGTMYHNNRNLYIVFRNSDVTSTKKFQPGGAVNWANDLFVGTSPFVTSDAGIADISDAGGVPAYSNCGSGATVTSC